MTTRSPGLVTVMTEHIMASVEPQVTTICVSGSMSICMRGLCLAASAARKLGAPHVMAYWCGPSAAALARRFLMASGGSKSGKPWERLMAPYCMETRVMRRMTESVNCAVRWLSSCMVCPCCCPTTFKSVARRPASSGLAGRIVIARSSTFGADAKPAGADYTSMVTSSPMTVWVWLTSQPRGSSRPASSSLASASSAV